jgi:two-component system, chemotaxis family, response regulator Rcp1
MRGLRPARILLVEDNPADVRLTQEAFSDGQGRCELTVARDGVEAMSALRETSAEGVPYQPDLVLLDLNLPRKGGREVLAEIKGDPQLRHIPVVVLTTSQAEQDVRQAYDLLANCYVVKPVDLDHFLALIRALEDFWLTTVRLPQMDAHG